MPDRRYIDWRLFGPLFLAAVLGLTLCLTGTPAPAYATRPGFQKFLG